MTQEAVEDSPVGGFSANEVRYRAAVARGIDDRRTVFRRGESTAVASSAAELLRGGPLAEQFTFLLPQDSAAGSEVKRERA